MTTARFISPFMTNGNINEYLENASGSGSLSLRLRLLGDSLNGLVYLHSLDPPICHGDIKPENVLINDRIEAVLCDFGLARLADGQPSGLTTTKTIKGSTRYMSPELVEENGTHTLSSDVWAYGCLALRVMTGSLPYGLAQTDQQVLLALALNRPPAKLDELKLQDIQAKRLLVKCWAINPGARPSAFECLQYLPKPGTNEHQLPGGSTRVHSSSHQVRGSSPSRVGSSESVSDSANSASSTAGTALEVKSEQLPSPPASLHDRFSLKRSEDPVLAADLPGNVIPLATSTVTAPVYGPPQPPGFVRGRYPEDVTTDIYEIEKERAGADRESVEGEWEKERQERERAESKSSERDPVAAAPPPAASSPFIAVTATATSFSQLTMAALTDLDPKEVPPELKKEGNDWFAIFNPQAQRKLDISLTLSLEHESVVCCVRFSPDGKFLATGCNKTAQIYDTKTGAKICTLNDETVAKDVEMYIRTVCFSPDGKDLATGAEDKQIRIWDIANRTIRQIFRGHHKEIYFIEFSPDGRVIVSGSGDHTVRVWNVKTGAQQILSIVEPNYVDAGVTSVAISPDGQLIAGASLDTIVRIWDITTGNLIERLRGHSDSVFSVAFTPDGKGLVSGSLDKTLKYWDLSSLLGSPNRTVGLSQGGSAPSGQQPVSNEGGEKGSTCSTTLSGHKDYVISLAISPDGAWVVSGSRDRGVRFWDPRTGLTQLMLQGHRNMGSYHAVKRPPPSYEQPGPQPANKAQTTFDRTRLRTRNSQGRAQPSLKVRKTSEKP
ncbi:general transcription repressor [Tulasnella sp. 408]|nr:general transcription repressor [Tulasnella sp. 408]